MSLSRHKTRAAAPRFPKAAEPPFTCVAAGYVGGVPARPAASSTGPSLDAPDPLARRRPHSRIKYPVSAHFSMLAGCWHKTARTVLGISVLMMIAGRCATPQLLEPVRKIIGELPPCSALREDLEHGAHGDGLDRPYMREMRQEGVQRALLEVRAVLSQNRPRQIRVVRRLYFHQFDGPDSQISDNGALHAIGATVLPAQLDALARDRALAAPFVRGHPPRPDGGQVSGFVEFLANGWLPEQRTVLVRSGHAAPLT